MSTDESPPVSVGPYAPIVRVGNWLICSGQLGLRDGVLVAGGVAAETACAISNLATVLASEGAALTDVKKTMVLLADIATFDEMNDAYLEAFGAHRPARSAFAVAGLPRGGHVEIEAWAYLA